MIVVVLLKYRLARVLIFDVNENRR